MNLIDIVKNAPEGATHYSPETCEVYLTYFKDNGWSYFLLVNSAGEWVKSERPLGSYDSALPLPKLKTEYRKVENSIWDLRPEFEAGKLYYCKIQSNGRGYKTSYHAINSEERLMNAALSKDIYRRVWLIMDEREEFKDKMKELVDEYKANHSNPDALGDFLYDNNCRFIE